MTETSPAADAIRAVIADLAAIPDATTRARALGDLLDAIPDLQAEIRAARQDAVVEMRSGMTLAETATALGISGPRVSQIVSGISRTAKK
ncbi:RNA polymerase subunit sigma-70 [Streptomyces sp. NPDC058757]|uniref:RNA polymerase subunit sigma-70 n=1 Tax=Streptomyces sp. NPDC058757 TaxID=3346626 RepID=UPI0036801542